MRAPFFETQCSICFGGRDEAELIAELARLEAEGEDEQQLEAEGDFPATLPRPSRPHHGDDDEEQEVRHACRAAVLTL